EGTGIEPTRANGFRYLEILQAQLRPSGLNGFPFGVNDFRLPVALYELRRRSQNVPEIVTQLDQAAGLLFAGKCREAEVVLEKVGSAISKQPALFADGAEAPDPNYRLASDILYRSGDGVSAAMQQRCRLDVYYPVNRKAFSTVIWFHGGGLSKGERSIPLPLRNKDVAVVSVNYRLAPGVKSPVYLEDAAAAIAWTFKNIAKYGGSADSIFLSGHSAGAYLSTMAALDPKWLAAHDIPTARIAGLIPFSSQMITHFAVREERGYDKNQAVVDDMAPLFHIQKNLPPMLLLTGDREQELYGRYEENAYFYRMAKLAGHEDVALRELQGFDHAKMPEPGFPLLLRFMEAHSGKRN
ncbi:MAG: alpha/beta hydrolase fold domain-containing protein, partial [Verrucomicrobiota bacterium]